MRIERLDPARPPAGPAALAALEGAVLARDVALDGERWPKGRRLTADDLVRLAASIPAPVTLLVPGPGDLHEDDAARRLALALTGGDPVESGVELRGPHESRIDLVAARDGVVRIRVPALERIARLDAIDPFTVLDGQAVAAGELVASVKVGPHLVAATLVERAEAIANGGRAIVRLLPYRRRRVAALVKESLPPAARSRFEASLREKVESLGSTLVGIRYAEAAAELTAALRDLVAGPDAVDLVLTAGAGGSDPADPLFTALAAVGGRVVRQGVPAHPGSMVWLGRARRTTILGVPSCGAYSKATAVDLLLAWLLAGAPPTGATVARLAHGGILSRAMRFRFPPYARSLDAPERGPGPTPRGSG